VFATPKATIEKKVFETAGRLFQIGRDFSVGVSSKPEMVGRL
jgi:hypothetical protein